MGSKRHVQRQTGHLEGPNARQPRGLEGVQGTGGKGGTVQRLKAFTLVTVVKRERGGAEIARDGKVLGYVPERQLRKVE